MPHLWFRYGAMSSGKSGRLLMDIYHYTEMDNKKAILIKPALDTRSEKVESRAGLSRKADIVLKVGEDFKGYEDVMKDADVLFVEEAHMLSPKQIEELWVKSMKVAVICTGLRTDFKGHLFPGSAKLLALADKIEEIKGMCKNGCESKATWNMRYFNNQPIFQGPQILIGGDESYKGVCKYCAYKAKKSE